MTGTNRVWWFLSIIAAVALATPASGTAAASCPGAYCPYYDYSGFSAADVRWPAARDGLVHIPFWVNPRQAWLSEADAVAAVREAAATWQRANPRIRFDYKGVTSDQPVPGDLKLVVAWAPMAGGAGMAVGKPGDYDIWMNVQHLWWWSPCRASCPPVPGKYVAVPGVNDPAVAYHEAQGVLTHEFGHVLGLGDLVGDRTAGLTMNVADYGTKVPWRYYDRFQSSLGLGEILGVKSLYPWSCPRLPRGVANVRQNYPPAYRQLCPTIQVFTP